MAVRGYLPFCATNIGSGANITLSQWSRKFHTRFRRVLQHFSLSLVRSRLLSELHAMPRKTDSDSEEEVKKSTLKTKRASKADVDAEEDANEGENVSGGDDEDDEPEYEIEAILDAKQGVFEQVRITNIHLTRFLRVVPLARGYAFSLFRSRRKWAILSSGKVILKRITAGSGRKMLGELFIIFLHLLPMLGPPSHKGRHIDPSSIQTQWLDRVLPILPLFPLLLLARFDRRHVLLLLRIDSRRRLCLGFG